MTSRYRFYTANYNEKLSDLVESIVTNVSDNVEAALGDFEDLLSTVVSLDPNDYVSATDGLLTLIDASIEAAGDLTDLIEAAFQSWVGYFQENLEAVADLLTRLFNMFGSQVDIFRSLILALASALSDFPALFVGLCKRAASQPMGYLGDLQRVLLPFFYAGMSVFGPDKAATAILMVLKDNSQSMTSRVTLGDLDLAPNTMSAIQGNLIESSVMKLPRGVLIIAGLIDALRQASSFASLLPNVSGISNPVLNSVFAPVADRIASSIAAYLGNVESLIEEVIANLLFEAENDFEIEWLILQLARFTPVGLFFVLIGTAFKLISNPAPWIQLILNPIENDNDQRVLRLPAPSEQQKYILLSDIHRDALSDQRPTYQFGSIDHFMPNRGQYLEILKHYAEIPEYTIIENGDCEELWFHRDFSQTPTQKLDEIIQTHDEIYSLLSDLHAQGRYIRVQGNHDSYLRNPNTFAVLRSAMESEGSPPFEVFDFVIIDGVKSMHDVFFHLGLDSHPNSERKPMLITHGHQWDFWNCDSNNILGKMIVSAVVTPLDMLDDPLRDIGGISQSGSPLMNFKQIIGNLPIFNSWQNYEPGVVRADQIQHMDDQQRRFTDDVMYSETLASLMGMLIPISPSNADMACPILNLDGRCLFNLMTIGHTHNPHNEPYYDLKVLPYVKDVLVGLQEGINTATSGLLDVELGLVKSSYLNTGVSGWHEDCTWAIDLGDESHGTGQPKLVSWSYNTRLDRPNHMDWELPHIQRTGSQTPGDIVDDYFNDLLAVLAEFTADRRDELLATLPIADLATTVKHSIKDWKPIDLSFDFSNNNDKNNVESLLYQLLVGFVSGQSHAFSVSIELPDSLTKVWFNAVEVSKSSKKLTHQESIAKTVALLSVTHEVGSSALNLGLGAVPDPLQHRACLGLLLLLSQLQQSVDRRIVTKLRSKGSKVEATVEFHANQTSIQSVSPELKSIQPLSRANSSRSRGVIVHVFLSGPETPLKGWRVDLYDLGDKSPKQILKASTSPDGEAELIRLQPDIQGYQISGSKAVKGPLALVLFTPDGTEVLRKEISGYRPVGHISMPVDFRQLIASDYFKVSKIRSREEKIDDLCEGWQKRLQNNRDPHVGSDLVINNLVLDILGGLDAPSTPLQKQAAKLLKQFTKQKKAIASVSEIARDAKGTLQDCLGDDYPEFDTSLSIEEIGTSLLNENSRFSGVKALFSNPLPDPLSSLPEMQPGRGIGMPINWDKVCRAQYLNGALDEDTKNQMDEFQGELVLMPPSINYIEVWDGIFAGGDVVRRTKIHEKIVSISVVKTTAGNVVVEDNDIDMDVNLESPECVVFESDSSGRQIVVTDVSPGQRISVYGSGYVSDVAKIHVSFRDWKEEVDAGRLVPDSIELAIDSFSNSETEVFGNTIQITEDTDWQTYAGDKVVFEWPDTAAKEGIYKVRLEFKNESEFPSEITQNEDCSITVNHDDVSTQEIYFVVLPIANEPSIRAMIKEVECTDITDPESILGIPYPDDLLLLGNSVKHTIEFTESGDDFTQVIEELESKMDDLLLYTPDTWDTAMNLFPTESNFSQLASFESIIVSFDLLEVEGEFDKFITQLLYLVAVIAIVLLVAAIVTALTTVVVAIVVGLGFLSAGTALAIAGPFLTAVYGFIFYGAFQALVSLQALLDAAVSGSDLIVRGTSQVDGARLKYRLSPVRYHHLLFPIENNEDDGEESLTSIDEVFPSDTLGGSYSVSVSVDTLDTVD